MTVISNLLVSIRSSNEYEGQKELGSKPDSSIHLFSFLHPGQLRAGVCVSKKTPTVKDRKKDKDRKKENLED